MADKKPVPVDIITGNVTAPNVAVLPSSINPNFFQAIIAAGILALLLQFIYRRNKNAGILFGIALVLSMLVVAFNSKRNDNLWANAADAWNNIWNPRTREKVTPVTVSMPPKDTTVHLPDNGPIIGVPYPRGVNPPGYPDNRTEGVKQ